MAALNAAAPRITDRLCDACAEHFASVRAHLDALGVPYRLEPGLVRGLDYYTRTAFEFYIAGPRGPAAGARWRRTLRRARRAPRWPADAGHRVRASGSTGCSSRSRSRARRRRRRGRRRSRSSSAPTRPTPSTRLRIATDLRAAGHRGPGRARRGASSASSSSRRPASSAHFAVIVGDELAAGEVQLRDLPAGTQKVVPLADLAREVARAHGAHRHGVDAGGMTAPDDDATPEALDLREHEARQPRRLERRRRRLPGPPCRAAGHPWWVCLGRDRRYPRPSSRSWATSPARTSSSWAAAPPSGRSGSPGSAPGTVGLDLSERQLEHARRRWPRRGSTSRSSTRVPRPCPCPTRASTSSSATTVR